MGLVAMLFEVGVRYSKKRRGETMGHLGRALSA
jgi:hypothetical protein